MSRGRGTRGSGMLLGLLALVAVGYVTYLRLYAWYEVNRDTVAVIARTAIVLAVAIVLLAVALFIRGVSRIKPAIQVTYLYRWFGFYYGTDLDEVLDLQSEARGYPVQQGDVLIYVGITGDLERRSGEHESKWWWRYVAGEGEPEVYKTRDAAERAEVLAIRRELPVANVKHNPIQRPRWVMDPQTPPPTLDNAPPPVVDLNQYRHRRPVA